MELLSSLNEIHIANSVMNAIERFNVTKKNSSDMPAIKRQLKKECDIIYFNIISSSGSGLKIMAKTIRHTYFYNYSFDSRTIELVGGVRKNVVTT